MYWAHLNPEYRVVENTDRGYLCCRPSLQATGNADASRRHHATWTVPQTRSARPCSQPGQPQTAATGVPLLQQGKPEKVKTSIDFRSTGQIFRNVTTLARNGAVLFTH